eukprot:TRINITY_DN14668_c0_g1_i3.p1 TRINITY_DN14668_c0_g1~~TRINITY_DN14668_c0_g1_i3.p1  ORF type:complete len:280 (-),score=32.93 TRINITY_DN14668_c0_g1_i3:172-1011(-)
MVDCAGGRFRFGPPAERVSERVTRSSLQVTVDKAVELAKADIIAFVRTSVDDLRAELMLTVTSTSRDLHKMCAEMGQFVELSVSSLRGQGDSAEVGQKAAFDALIQRLEEVESEVALQSQNMDKDRPEQTTQLGVLRDPALVETQRVFATPRPVEVAASLMPCFFTLPSLSTLTPRLTPRRDATFELAARVSSLEIRVKELAELRTHVGETPIASELRSAANERALECTHVLERRLCALEDNTKIAMRFLKAPWPMHAISQPAAGKGGDMMMAGNNISR